MFEYYEKLFPLNLRYSPYKNDSEHIWDRIKLLDIMIYNLLIDKKNENKQNEINNLVENLLTPANTIEKNKNDSMGEPEKKERSRILEFIKQYIKDREEVSSFAKVSLSILQIEEAFKMNDFVKTCLITSLVYEMNKKYGEIYTYINNNDSMGYPNAYVALKICGICTELYDEVIPNIASLKAIKNYIFAEKSSIMLDQKNDMILPLKLNERIQKFLIKSDTVEYEKISYFELFNPNNSELDTLEFNDDIRDNIKKIHSSYCGNICYNKYSKAKIIFIKGLEGVGKKFYIKHSAKELEKKFLFIDMSQFINRKDEILELKKEISRECLIQNATPCLNGIHKLDEMENEKTWLLHSLLMELKNISEIIFITSEESLFEIMDSEFFSVTKIEIENLRLNKRIEYWEKYILNKKLKFDTDINSLVNKFSFTPGQIKKAINNIEYKAYLNEDYNIKEEDIYDVCNSLAFNKLSNLATLIKPIYSWDDLVLKNEHKEILRQACNHIKYKHIVYDKWGFNEKRAYGNGVCVLFTGPPGTGKTMGAQVVANELHLDMYKVDLSAITSKYIGETEKNIKKLFSEAKKSNAVLFFDEADTIFGKRTEVKDSHDKHANMDAAYLLQKIEEYEGISILATNYIQNIDDAFIRRISFIIRYSMPDVSERKEIWQKSFPKLIPIEREIDFDFLAMQFQLSGSNIKNIALHSAFLAASNNEGLSMKHIINALKTEYLKVNKILLKEDFGPYFL